MRQYDRIGTVALAWASFVLGTALVQLAVVGAPSAFAGQDVVARLLRAGLVLVVVLVVLALLRRRRQVDLALRDPWQLLTGAGVVAVSAAVVLGADHLAGGTSVDGVDLATLLPYVALTLLVTGLQEAVPEELALRGAVYGTLRETTRGFVAGALTTVLFVLAPGAGITLGALVGRLLGLPTDGPALAPDGTDPVAYLVLLTLFGTMLVAARAATGSVWTCVGAHLVFLLVNRVLVVPQQGTGVQVRTPEGAELLVPVYLLVATAAFLLLGHRRRRRLRRAAGQTSKPPQTAVAPL